MMKPAEGVHDHDPLVGDPVDLAQAPHKRPDRLRGEDHQGQAEDARYPPGVLVSACCGETQKPEEYGRQQEKGQQRALRPGQIDVKHRAPGPQEGLSRLQHD